MWPVHRIDSENYIEIFCGLLNNVFNPKKNKKRNRVEMKIGWSLETNSPLKFNRDLIAEFVRMLSCMFQFTESNLHTAHNTRWVFVCAPVPKKLFGNVRLFFFLLHLASGYETLQHIISNLIVYFVFTFTYGIRAFALLRRISMTVSLCQHDKYGHIEWCRIAVVLV